MRMGVMMAAAALAAVAGMAMPTAQEIQKAQPVVGEAMKDTMAAVNAKQKTPVEAADVSMGLVGDADSEAAKYLLLRGAVVLYARGGDYDRAADTVETLRKTVADVPPETMAEVLSAAVAGLAEEKAPRLYAQYREARRVAGAKRAVAEIQPQIRKNPRDAVLRRRYAENLALSGDWPEALKQFARLDQRFATLAVFERTGVATDGMNALKAADFWWGYAAPDPEPFRAHAAEWYRKALAEEGLVSGLQRGIVAKRLAEFEASLKPKPAAMPVAARGREVPKITDLSADYLVVDLSAGPDATAYPVSGLPDIPPEGWTEEYKTTKLVLRRIEAGTFVMGKDQKDKSHHVKITKPFYCGIFEVTQKQYELVTGDKPSYFNNISHYATRPVERVSYNTIRGLTRGAQWPVSSEVDSGSFIGKIRARTGLDFDLPTEAQWEYSCRAGTTSDFNNGGDSMDDLKLLGRFGDNKSDGKGGYSEHTTVGLYLPNAWGLYDMHGNVWEWCLDWRSDSSSGGTDPVGASSGEHRVKLGGGWYNDAGRCTSSSRGSYSVPSIESNDFGFRLSLTLKDEKDDAKNADATSAEKPKAGVQDNSAGTGQTKTELPLWMKKQAKAGEERSITLPGGAEMRFRWCPAGKFMMGSPKSEKGRNDDETEHRVTLTKGFWMGETEVTQKQWESVMGNNPAQFKGVDRPVEQVSWDDCQQFCERVSEELKCGMRLPTEAEWEYACRAGTTEASYLKSKTGDSLAWHKANSNKETHPVGQKKPNAWGLCDMYGNVWEWCSDWYAEYSSAAVTDPAGPALGSEHIMRGGSWYDTDGIHAIRSANRGRFSIPKSFNIGFRVVLDEDK